MGEGLSSDEPLWSQGTIPPSSDERTSVILRRVMAGASGADIQLQDLSFQFRRRSFGGLLLLLALTALLPGISILAGLLVLGVGFQMAMGLRSPKFPTFLANTSIPVSSFKRAGGRLIQVIESIEKKIRPRWFFLTTPPMATILGVTIMLLGLVILSPLPFSNFPPAFALLFVAFGLVERDGMVIAFGMFLSLGAIATGFAMLYLGWEGLILILNRTTA